MYDSAKALAFTGIPPRSIVKTAVFDTLKANNMFDDAHIRLTLTRGEKITSGMDPRLNTKGCGLIVLAEFKSPVYNKDGIKIITSAIRRNTPQFLDSKIHHNNLLNNIQAKIQANVAGVDDALMLDDQGFASELNGTNIFMCKNNIVYTPSTDSCLPGITREMVIHICKTLQLDLIEKNISLTDLYSASEVFTTGTMGELVPINYIDGRQIQNSGRIFPQINERFIESIPDHCHPIN
jgi:branched-chain amino acid aminotransferase